MKQYYKAKTPTHVMFGDPMYYREFEGEKLDSLVVDCHIPENFSTRIVLEEGPSENYPDNTERWMTLYFAPDSSMDVYLSGLRYEQQKIFQKDIGVDSASYLLSADEEETVVKTNGDGWWGEYVELYRGKHGQEPPEAIIITILQPEYDSNSTIYERAKSLFSDMEMVQGIDEQSITPTITM